MRLLDVYDFTLKSGLPDQSSPDAQFQSTLNAASRPPYAILSHRWVGDNEVKFKELPAISKSRFSDVPSQNPVSQDPHANLSDVESEASSVYKIAGACRKVREANSVRHIWIDTVCIDKSNSQELSTAINSMFRWYEEAEICYVYLFDVSWNNAGDKDSHEQFAKSQWFRRGWTLQELLAPKQVEFFDRDWKHIGSKQGLMPSIAKAARISPEHLESFGSASLAQKMSWLANRETTCPEDMAYCMLGILKMPKLYMDTRYGQSLNEFLRLQMEIIKIWGPGTPFDESLFAWKSNRIESSRLLAPRPDCFSDCGDLIFDRSLAKLRPLAAFRPRLSQRERVVDGLSLGIQFDDAKNMTFVGTWVLAVPIAQFLFAISFGILTYLIWVPANGVQSSKSQHYFTLNCWSQGDDGKLGVKKIKMEKGPDNTWRRIECDKLYSTTQKQIYPSKWVGATYPIEMRITNDVQYKKNA